MSTWTSETVRLAALTAACLTLAACGGNGFRISGGGNGGNEQPAPAQVAVTTDRVVVAGPDGYCVDPTATQDNDETGFVLLGNCAAISNSRRADQPTAPAVLTAAISAPSETGTLADNMDELDGFFRSQDGLTLLSRSGDPASVTILDTEADGDMFFLHATDTSESRIDGVQGTYWRAYLDVGARIATLSVLQPEGSELSDAGSRNTLRAFTQAVRAANVGSPGVSDAFDAAPQAPAPARTASPAVAPNAVPTVAPAPSGPRTLPLDARPLRNVGLLRRIFG